MVAPASSFRLRLFYSLFTLAGHHALRILGLSPSNNDQHGHIHSYQKRELSHTNKIVFSCLVPILVLLSGLFAGLTLGYMSLDDTQLNVLSISGSPKQQEYARKIQPIRKNGHLLLVTLLLANMITNETLPIVADPLFNSPIESVVVSTALIVIFAEIIPQSIFTRHGLYLGAKMAWLTRGLIYLLFVVSWPAAKILEFVLGPHHGIIYRRTELKELIAMHSAHQPLGGDLKNDTVAIIGATLDLQEKVVKQAMTPISDVFMLNIDSKLDYELLKKICLTGHSRVPVYEEVEVPVNLKALGTPSSTGSSTPSQRTQKVKKVLGILLVKQLVLLDPKDSIPIRKLPLNKVPFVPNNMALLGILDKFQEGRSHMAIVSRFSQDKAASVKKAVKGSLTQRLRERVGIIDSDSSDEEKESSNGNGIFYKKHKVKDIEEGPETEEENEPTLNEDGLWEKDFAANVKVIPPDAEPEQEQESRRTSEDQTRPPAYSRGRGRTRTHAGRDTPHSGSTGGLPGTEEEGQVMTPPKPKQRASALQIPKAAMGMASMSNLEQSMPADAVLAKSGAEEFLQNFDPAIMPLGIITLEDVLEELIGEEIYDEFDPQGAHGDPYVPPPAPPPMAPDASANTSEDTANQAAANPNEKQKGTTPTLKPLTLKGLGFLRSRSAPPTPRDANPPALGHGEKQSAEAPAATSGSGNTPGQAKLGASNMNRSITAAELEEGGGQEVVIPASFADLNSGQGSPPPSEASNVAADDIVKPSVSKRVSYLTPAANPNAGRGAPQGASLEAILLERKRRAGLAGASTSSLVTHGSGAPPMSRAGSAKGSITGTGKALKFKSSPLSGEGRGGVVVAEKLKKEQEGAEGKEEEGKKEAKEEDGRIPEGKDKEGPDKE